jgi:Holliday junction resolvasome RuvABC endonuclease subunit
MDINSVLPNELRVLAVDPCSRGFGFAVLEGPQRLIDWGVRGVHDMEKNSVCLREVAEMIQSYQPDAIVIENYGASGSRRCLRVRGLLKRIRELGVRRRIKVRTLSRLRVRQTFGQDARNKHQIAVAIGARFPELAPHVPPYRKCWMSEDYRMSIFDAVAFALTYYEFARPSTANLDGETNEAAGGVLRGQPRR